MTTPDAKGIFPEDHALSLRNYGITACAWPDVYIGTPGQPDQFDALIVLGSSLGELATTVVNTDQFSKNLVPSGHFIHVDLDESTIGRNFPITSGIVAISSRITPASARPDVIAIRGRPARSA